MVRARVKPGWYHEIALTFGQSCGGIWDMLPAAEIMQHISAETAAALTQGPLLAS